MREDTCAAITASAHAAALQGGSAPSACAVATFSQAIQAQLQVTLPSHTLPHSEVINAVDGCLFGFGFGFGSGLTKVVLEGTLRCNQCERH